VAVKALRHWQCVKKHTDRAMEYRQLADEIGAEIEARLDAALALGMTKVENGKIYMTENQQEHK
jgi:hypothetical protein